MVQRLHNSKAGIQPNKVRQLQRAHGHIGAVLHDVIDILFLAHARLQTDDGLIDVGHEDAIGEEARGVGANGGDFAHALAELHGIGDGFGGGLDAGDDLDALLDGDRVHEVRADHAGAGGGVGGVCGGGGGDLGDGDGGGVGGEDGVGGTDLRELGEDFGFELWDLGDGFDYHVDVGEVFHLERRCEACPSFFGGGFGDALFRDVFGEELVGEREAFVQRSLGTVYERHGHGGFLGRDEGDAEALRQVVSTFSGQYLLYADVPSGRRPRRPVS